MSPPLISKAAARYTGAGGKEHCSLCRHFSPRRGGRCARVLGDISPRGWCRLFSREMRGLIADASSFNSGGGPSLGLDFMVPGVLDPRITFTRASTATYFDSAGILRTATTNTPRWDYDPVTLALRGLLLEDARTNLAFPSTNWKANATASSSVEGVVQNVGVSPSGANDAMAFIPGAFNALHWQYSTFTGAVNTTYTLSVFAKAAGLNFFWIRLDNTGFSGVEQWASFNLSTGVIDSQSGTSARIQSVGNGWYRCAVTATSNATAGATYIAELAPMPVGGFITSNTGNNVSGTWVWGGQIEVGAFASSYIPTTSAAVARAAEFMSMPASGWYNPTAGSLAVEVIYGGTNGGAFPVLASLDDGTANNAAIIINKATGFTHAEGTAGGVNQWGIAGPTGSTPYGTVKKAGLSMALNNISYCINGALATVDLAATLPAVTTLHLGCNATGATGAHSVAFRRVSYWSRALSAAELQTVTT